MAAQGNEPAPAQDKKQAGGSDSPKRKPGRPRVPNPKQAVSLRLDPDVLAKFRATGPGWQRRMNDVLKNAQLCD